MIEEIKEQKLNYILYTFMIAFASALLWAFAKSFAMPVIMISCAIVLLWKNDLKYGLPFIVNFLFVNGKIAASSDIDIGLIVGGVVLIITIIVFILRNKLKLKLGYFGLNLWILAILALVPVLWSEIATGAFYFLYLSWLAYLVVYLFFVNSIKEDIKEEFSYTMEGLIILLSLECLLSIFRLKVTGGSLNDIYSLGWGICNEAGIMLCVAIPFAFYKFYTTLKTKENILHLGVLLLGVIGIVATLSRGTIIFAALEYGLMILYMLLNKKLYKTTIILVILGLALVSVVVVWKFDFFLGHAIDFIDNNGRFDLYNKALFALNKNPRNFLFGAGFAFDTDFKDAVFVCHSTIYETLVCMGVVGLIFLLIHFALKYNLVMKKPNSFNSIMLIGFIVVDLYGLIDNTYHMYYYMIILVMILAVIEKANKLGVE